MSRHYVTLVFVCVFYGSVHASTITELINRKQIFSIEYHSWIMNSGMHKGLHHDRQDLGIILKNNTQIKLRQENYNPDKEITVTLDSDDLRTDKKAVLRNDWVTLSTDVPAVPFIKTPFGEKNVTILYTVIGPTEPLPIYELGYNESEFFTKWDHFDTTFALIKNQFFQLLVPKNDKHLAKNMKNNGFIYKSLDDLLRHYEELFSYYNELAGLDDSSPTDRKSKNRFFLRGLRDCDGALGRCGYHWAASCEGTTEPWFETKWLHLHEIGHGFEPEFKGTNVHEIANNLFGMFYLYNRKDREDIHDYWIEESKRMASREGDFLNEMKKHSGIYEKLDDPWHKLRILIMLTEKAGIQAVTKMYKAHRAAANNELLEQQSFSDLIHRHYSDYAQLDFTPVLEQFGFQIKSEESLKNRCRGYRAVTALRNIVPAESLPAAYALLNKKIYINEYVPVDNDDISSFGLSGGLLIKLVQNQYSHNVFKLSIAIKDGNKVIKTQTLTNDYHTEYIPDIPNGVYSIEVIGSPEETYQLDNYYIFIKNQFINVYKLMETDNNMQLKLIRHPDDDLLTDYDNFVP